MVEPTHRLPLRWLDSPSFFWLVAALFVATRLPLALLTVAPSSDAAWYVARAAGIAAGHGYVEGGLPTAYWPVGYPAFLAGLFRLFGTGLLAPKLANLLLGAGTLVLILQIARLMHPDERAARLAVLLYACYPNQAAYTPLMLSEVSFTFLFMLAVWVFIRRPALPSAAAFGALAGLATLVKAQTILFPPFLFGLWYVASRGRVSLKRATLRLAIAYGACLVVIAPWSLRNHNVFGSFVLVSTNGGLALWNGNNPNANGDVVPDALVPPELHPNVRDQVAIDRRARREAVGWIRENPWEALALMPRKIWRLWGPDGEGEWGYQAGFAPYDRFVLAFRAVRILNQLYYACVLLAFAWATLRLVQRRPCEPWAWLPLAVVANVTMISMVFSGQSRYHFPAMPWVMIAAAWAVAELAAGTLRTAPSPRPGGAHAATTLADEPNR